MINKMTASEKAWAAGYFEGEGCVYVFRNTQSVGTGSKVYLYARVIISSTDVDVLKRWQKVVGVGHIYKRNGLKSEQCKQEFQLHFQGYEIVKELAEVLGPWLGKRRRAQFKRVLAEAKDGRARKVEHK